METFWYSRVLWADFGWPKEVTAIPDLMATVCFLFILHLETNAPVSEQLIHKGLSQQTRR